MALLICDRCKHEWDTKDIKFDEIILCEQDGAKMRFFQCPECGEEYIVDVTDSELRKKIAVYKRMKQKYLRMFREKASPTKLRNYSARMESVQGEIRAREKELRTRWTRSE